MRTGPGHSMVNNSTGQSIVCVQSRPVFQGYREQNLTATEPATEAGNFGNISLFHYGLSSCQQAHMQCETNPKLTMLNTQVPLTCSSEPPKTEQSRQGPVPVWTHQEQDLLFKENLRTDNMKAKYLQTLEFGNPADPPKGRRWNRRLSGRSFPALKIKEKIK